MTSPTTVAPTESTSSMDRSIHLAIDPSPINGRGTGATDSGHGGTLSDPSNAASDPPSSTTTEKSPKSIDEQLAETLASQAARRQYLSDTMPRNPTLLSNLVHAVSTDHNTARLALICLSLVCSFFGALVLVLVGPDAPYQEGALYQYSDLMRLMTSIHEKSIEITPSLSRRSFEEELKKNGSSLPAESDPESESTRISRLLSQWWPIQKIDYESSDAVLNDTNFYARNYATFQTAFIILLVFGDLILLFSWLYFLAAKELQIYRHRKHRLAGTAPNRIKSPKPLKEKATVLVEKLKRFLSGKAIKQLKRSWFDDPPRRPWQRPAIVVIASLISTDLLLFTILLSRPSFFALILHQVLFTLLSIVCLASTEVHGEEGEPSNWGQNGQTSSPKETVKEVPRSLRNSKGSNGSQNSSQKSLIGSLKKNKVTAQTRELIAATVNEAPKAIFATEESKASTSGQMLAEPRSPHSLRGSNPFDEDEDDDSDSDEMYRSLAAKQKPSIDEQAERDIERV